LISCVTSSLTFISIPRLSSTPLNFCPVLRHSLKLKNQKEWRNWAKTLDKPEDIPANPSSVYKDQGWISFGDWLGTGTIAPFNRVYRPFEEARAFVHQLQLKNRDEWRDWAQSTARPQDIPANPSGTYKDEGWIGFGDWLGTGTIAPFNRVYRPFEEARAFVHQLHLKNRGKWLNWTKTEAKPDDIPTDPSKVYKDQGWNGWGDWLGTGTIAVFNRSYRPFEEARAFAHSLQLKSGSEWREWAKTDAKPSDIPANPKDVYKYEGWNGWGDWVGTGTIAVFNRSYRPFEKARAFAHSLQLKSGSEWREWAKTT